MTDHATELNAWQGVARLFAIMLLREIDAPLLAELNTFSAELEKVGIELPTEDQLEELAAEYFQLFVNPKRSLPLVESLYRTGSYEGADANDVRAIAESAGLEWDSDSARGVPVDHLGSLLMLWAHLVPLDRTVAEQFAIHHLAWAPSVLSQVKEGRSDRNQISGEVFYPRLCAAISTLIEAILDASQISPADKSHS